MFENGFQRFVCGGDTIAADIGNGLRAVARLEYDQDTQPDDFDCYSARDKARWRKNEWFFCGVVLSVWIDDICIDSHAASLWGIEANFGDDHSYLTEVAQELLAEAKPRAIAEAVRDRLITATA